MSEEIQRDRESAYEQVKRFIIAETANQVNAPAVKEQHLKTSLCSHGRLEPEQVEKVVRALGEQEKIVYGSGWITVVLDDQWLREALGHVVENGDSPKEFVRVVNMRLHG